MQHKNPKVKTKIYKKWWFWTIVGVLFLGVLGSLQDKDKPTTASNNNTQVAQAQTDNKKSEEVKKEDDKAKQPAETEKPKEEDKKQVENTDKPKEEPKKEEPKQEVPTTNTKAQETQPVQASEPVKEQASTPASTNNTETYIGNKSTHKFHRNGCSDVGNMADKNKVTLNSREEAISDGYVPCKKCNP